jgi:hypothetical protein
MKADGLSSSAHRNVPIHLAVKVIPRTVTHRTGPG